MTRELAHPPTPCNLADGDHPEIFDDIDEMLETAAP